jgi:hypothetical protein
MSSREFLGARAKAYDVELPARYRKFIDKKEYEKLGDQHLRLITGYLRGTFSVDFLDPALADLGELGEQQLIDDMDDVDWAGEFSDFIPFATLVDAAAEEEDEEVEPVKGFLIVSVTDAACPVLLWDYDGWMIYPLAKSLDDFLAGVASGKRLDHDRAGSPYKRFAWVDPGADEDEDEDEDDDDGEDDEY